MDPAARNIAKQQYESVRRSLTAFDERVLARYWDQGALVREGFEHVLGSLDQFAGWLLDEQRVTSVDVTFTLPADVDAESVALCGEFNQWAVEGIALERDSDGTWRTTVPLEPGRSYRYRFLLDGERWVNAPQADQYVPNPYGSLDSVVIVEPA